MKISKIYNFASNPGTIFTLVCAILSFSFPGTANAIVQSNAAHEINAKDYSGDDLFNAIFLMRGDLVDQIPTLSSVRNQAQDLGEMHRTSYGDKLYNDMKDSHPDYFTELEKAVNSGNHYSIEQSVVKGSELILLNQYTQAITALTENSELNEPDISGYNLQNEGERKQAVAAVRDFLSSEYGAELAQVCGTWLAFAMAVAVAVAWVVAWVAFWGVSADVDSEVVATFLKDNTISKDQIIEELASLR